MSQNKRILIVDDDPEIRSILRLYLAKKYDVLEAASGFEAFSYIDETPPDLFIVDALMPRFNGFLFIEILRAMKRFRETPVIMLTAMDEEGDINEGLRKGATVYLVKPVDREKLLEAIEGQLRN